MSLVTLEERPVHFPAKPDVFEFDQEVAQIFDNMASRSIPGYKESTRLTACLVRDLIRQRTAESKTTNILDIGASTGYFYKVLFGMLERPAGSMYHPYLHAVAVDKSPYMVDRIRNEVPGVLAVTMDAMEIRGLLDMCERFDVINLAYVMQFLPMESRSLFTNLVYDMLNPGGIVLFSSKTQAPLAHAEFYQNSYVQFRRDNGYTDEEIQAKTEALRNAMWVESRGRELFRFVDCGFSGYDELCSWLQFSTAIIRK